MFVLSVSIRCPVVFCTLMIDPLLPMTEIGEISFIESLWTFPLTPRDQETVQAASTNTYSKFRSEIAVQRCFVLFNSPQI